MNEDRKWSGRWLKWTWPVPLLLYVGGYFALGDYSALRSGRSCSRIYQNGGITFAYIPLGWLEATVTRRRVILLWREPDKECRYGFEPWGQR